MSEDWKGDDNEIVGHSWFGPVTKKQQQEAERQQKALMAKRKDLIALSAFSYDALPVVSIAESCPKCGQTKLHIRHHAAAETDGDNRSITHLAQTGLREFMAVHCKKCEYTWCRRPMQEDE